MSCITCGRERISILKPHHEPVSRRGRQGDLPGAADNIGHGASRAAAESVLVDADRFDYVGGSFGNGQTEIVIVDRSRWIVPPDRKCDVRRAADRLPHAPAVGDKTDCHVGVFTHVSHVIVETINHVGSGEWRVFHADDDGVFAGGRAPGIFVIVLIGSWRHLPAKVEQFCPARGIARVRAVAGKIGSGGKGRPAGHGHSAEIGGCRCIIARAKIADLRMIELRRDRFAACAQLCDMRVVIVGIGPVAIGVGGVDQVAGVV